MLRESTWLDCAEPGCTTGTSTTPRDLPALTAGGGWYCPDHDNED